MRNSEGTDAHDFAEFVIAFESTNETTYSRDIENIGRQVTVPKCFYNIALTATVYFAFECAEQLFIVNRVEDALQLGHNGQGRFLILGMLDFSIKGDHSEDATFLGGLDLAACSCTLRGFFINNLYTIPKTLSKWGNDSFGS